MYRQEVVYWDGETELHGYVAFKNKDEKKPGVLIAPAWKGRDEIACKKAEEIADLGYVGFALDMYGKAKLGKNTEENSQLIQPFMKDRLLLRRRMQAACQKMRELEMVDANQLAAIGFCFGGLCALDLARSGVDLKAVVSFHGLLSAPENISNQTIKAKILALHGFDDPMVTPEAVLQFENEMTRANVDWQVHVYGKTMHAFTNPEANDRGFGTVYNPTAAKRAWQSMKNFFEEVLTVKK